jgi:hypothetical protein
MPGLTDLTAETVILAKQSLVKQALEDVCSILRTTKLGMLPRTATPTCTCACRDNAR